MTAPAITRPAAGTTIDIPVTAAHILSGRPRRAQDCPIAQAIFDAMPGTAQADVWPCVDSGRAPAYAHVVLYEAGSVELCFGEDAQRFIFRYDADCSVEPAVFTAEVIA